jgi:probable F420-dependent oxidoreductase
MTTAMRLGFSLPVAGAWATLDNLVTVARRAEALRYASVWAFQRLLYALEPKNEYYGAPGPTWPKPFERVLDPIVALTYAAAVTERIRLGTSVLITPFYQPAVLAKLLATLDVVSRGRLHVGLGIGWARDEYDAVGVPFRDRGARAEEFLRCLKAIWTDDVVEFHGRFYQVPRSRIEPKPVQRPHPPITLGGYSPATVRRAVTLADGYNGGNVPLDGIAALVAEVRSAASAAGRDPATVEVVCRGSFRVHATPQGPARRALWGTLDEIRADVARYAAAGVTELFLEANFDPDIDLDRALESMEALAP